MTTFSKHTVPIKSNQRQSAELWIPSSVEFNSGTPLKPFQPTNNPRKHNYLSGRNMLTAPGYDKNRVVSYDSMRKLANTYGILRSVIEQRKDEIRGLDWNITVRKEYSGDRTLNSACLKAQHFFEYPDLEHTFDQWIGMLLEDLFVTDTACLYKERDRLGRFRKLEIMDGTTILCLIDETGRIPDSPQMAYQQIINGIPYISFMKPVPYNTTNYELYYRPYNLSSGSVYGFSHVESILYIINIALRKDTLSLSHFTDSNVPRGFLQVSEKFVEEMMQNPDAYQGIQDMLDNLVAGNTSHQNRLVIVPGVTGAQMLQNEVEFNGTYEEWLARVVCARFGVSPAPYARMINRASAKTQEESRQEYALIPMLQHFKSWFDQILRNDLNMPFLEFIWDKGANYNAPKAQLDIEQLKMGIKTIDDIRTSQGLSPLPDGMGSIHMVWQNGTMVPLKEIVRSFSNVTLPVNKNPDHSLLTDIPKEENNQTPMDRLHILRLQQQHLIKSELRTWKKYELKHLYNPHHRPFVTRHLSRDLSKHIRKNLKNSKTADDINQLFKDCLNQ